MQSSERAHTDVSQTIWAPADDEAEVVGERHGFLQRGDQLGRYLILGRLGTGGMGVVYAAYDPELDRKVALKLMRRGSSDPARREAAQERLLQEARAMARLAHPNVVAVHDVAVIGGRVFMAMELIDGETLAEALERHDADWRDRLAILVQAGRGLAAAHEAGVVHGDFKPENVMLGRDGRVRVMDFGLARGIEDHGAGPGPAAGMSREDMELASGSGASGEGLLRSGTRSSTQPPHNRIAGTPAYMAPEQHDGVATDARTDQFSFCVSLYEALYGVRPFRGEAPKALADEIRAGKVGLPPEDTRVPAWVHAVLLRALSVRPEDRYPSMSALLAALSNDPAIVRRRWMTRGGLALLVVAGVLGVRQVLLDGSDDPCAGAENRLEGVWDEARKREAREAFEAVDRSYATDAWQAVSPALDRQAASWVQMHRDACEANKVRGEQSDALLDLRMQCLQRRLAELDALAELFVEADEPVVRRSVDAAYALVSVEVCADIDALRAPVPPPEDPQQRIQLEHIRLVLAQAKALEDAGRFQSGLGQTPDAVQQARELGYAPLLAEALYQHGRLALAVDDLDEAERSLREAVQVAAAGHHDEIEARAWVSLLRVVGYAKSQTERGHEIAAAAMASVTRAGGSADLRAELASSQGAAAVQRHDLDEAGAFFEEALALEQERLDADHPRIANALNNLAAVLVLRERHAEAKEMLARAIEIYERGFGEEHPNVAKLRLNVSSLEMGMGNLAEARAHVERAIQIWERAFEEGHAGVGRGLINLADIAMGEKRFEEAQEHAARAVEILQPHLGDHPQLAMALSVLGSAQRELGRSKPAIEALERAVKMSEDTLGAAHPQVGPMRVELAEAHAQAGRYEEAIAALERVLSGSPEASMNSDIVGRARFSMARALWAVDRDRKRAVELARAARSDLERGVPGVARGPSIDDVDRWLADK